MTTEQTLSAKLDARPATFTCDKSKVGPLYYFAITDRAPGPYKTQRHVEAILDIASDGTLAGVELIDNMPPPPALTQSIRTTEAGVVVPVGWYLVPEVPTEEQMAAGLYQSSHDAEYSHVCQSYMDMVRVPVDAPALSQPPAEGVMVTDAMVERITGHLFNRLGLSRWGLRVEDVREVVALSSLEPS